MAQREGVAAEQFGGADLFKLVQDAGGIRVVLNQQLDELFLLTVQGRDPFQGISQGRGFWGDLLGFWVLVFIRRAGLVIRQGHRRGLALHDVQVLLQLVQASHAVVEQICQFTVSGDAHGGFLVDGWNGLQSTQRRALRHNRIQMLKSSGF